MAMNFLGFGHRVLQQTAQREGGGEIFASFLCGSAGPFSCSEMSLFYLKTCTSMKGTL